MSLQAQQELIVLLGESGDNIPGLQVDQIIENLVDKSEELKGYNEIVESEIQDNIDRGMSIEDARNEANEKKDQIIETVKGRIKPIVEEQITVIKQEAKNLKDGIERIPDDVAGIIANILLPPAIAVPAAAPNPVYALNLAKKSKNDLSTLVDGMSSSLTEILKASNQISFVLPNEFLGFGQTIATLKATLDTIPL